MSSKKFSLYYTLKAFLFLNLLVQMNIYAKWDGPTDGPPGLMSRNIIFIASDTQNGGVSAVYRGFETAGEVLTWKIKIFNGSGDKNKIKKIFLEAIQLHPDAIVIGGFQPEDISDSLEQAKKSKIILIGWHAGEKSGPTKDLFVNVTTDAKEVAKTAAEYAIKDSRNKGGFVILNDNNFAIANAKTKFMREIIEACKKCKLLTVENVPISKADELMLEVVPRLNDKFKKSWTHTLAINDIYFDNMNFPLSNIGRKDIKNVSAGDGSNKALSRIRSGFSQQIATVAEPLSSQGWQLVDELNRAFSGKPPSGYISKPILVTPKLLERLKKSDVDSGIGYEEAYIKIWGQNKIKNKK
ncbi:substrate-binding domain-containing protein [Fluviispira multicolorata]|uniref:Substrate-binding domain-containing protein n=1 Tax=Fluviispira multicolorata TaxID=2654512 RepID=A0A833N272_9BACT|nr:substrate-binding domain-containing protein [Fluviispira multicolorata]KAB8027732.1 substrate-binding domain-containing protein [Fluviispira multicolorata]